MQSISTLRRNGAEGRKEGATDLVGCATCRCLAVRLRQRTDEVTP